MTDKFRRNVYFRLIYSDKGNYTLNPEIYITPLSWYLISWKEFYSLCVFSEDEKRKWEKFYRRYYISSNQSFIDSHNGCEIDTFKYLKVDCCVLIQLKWEFPDCYTEFLKNYQIQLLIKKFPQYMQLAKSQQLKIENSAFNYTNSSVDYYISLEYEIKNQEQKDIIGK